MNLDADLALPGTLKHEIVKVLAICGPLTVDGLKPHFPQTPRRQIVLAIRQLQAKAVVKERQIAGIGEFRVTGKTVNKVKGNKPAHPDADTVILRAEPKISSSWWAGKSRVDFSAAHKERFGA